MLKTLFTIFFHLILLSSLLAQEIQDTSSNNSNIYIKHTTEKIVLDGVLNESVWSNEVQVTEFWQYFPNSKSWR